VKEKQSILLFFILITSIKLVKFLSIVSKLLYSKRKHMLLIMKKSLHNVNIILEFLTSMNIYLWKHKYLVLSKFPYGNLNICKGRY